LAKTKGRNKNEVPPKKNDKRKKPSGKKNKEIPPKPLKREKGERNENKRLTNKKSLIQLIEKCLTALLKRSLPNERKAVGKTTKKNEWRES
jgi:hypothetical protein